LKQQLGGELIAPRPQQEVKQMKPHDLDAVYAKQLEAQKKATRMKMAIWAVYASMLIALIAVAALKGVEIAARLQQVFSAARLT